MTEYHHEHYLFRSLLNYIHELSAEVVDTAERGNAILAAINETIYHEKSMVRFCGPKTAFNFYVQYEKTYHADCSQQREWISELAEEEE